MIYIVRHGETDWNKENRIQGLSEISLNGNGVRQALAVGERLKDIKFDYVFTSPLLRSYQTIRHILSKRKIDDRPNVITDARLVECCYGDWEGKVRPTSFNENYYGHRTELKFKDAESINDVEQRIKSFFDEIIKLSKSKNILVITHGGFIRIATRYFTGQPIDRDYSTVEKVSNCEVITYDPVKTLYCRYL